MTRPDNLTPGRRRLFTLGALVIPVLVLVLAESLLAVFDVAPREPLFIPVPGQEDYLVPNPEVGRRYFGSTSVVPGPPQDGFLSAKPENAFRVVVQGGSSAAGFPYGHGGAFPRMLEQRLAQTFPERSVEVVNTGMDAVNSWTLLDLQSEIVEARPDAVLIYAGHNEYYGALGVASTESAGGLWSTSLYLQLNRYRLFRALGHLWSRLRPTPSASAQDISLMQEMAAGKEVTYGSAEYLRGVRQFRRNMERLVCTYTEAGVPVFLGTIVSNERDQSPFGPAGASGLGTENVNALLASGDSLEALATVRGQSIRDSTAAGPRYLEARILDGQGDHAEAAPLYAAAKDRDAFPFRAPSAINAALGEVASSCGAVLVDVRARFVALSPTGTPGKELILEHLHPNVNGYFVIADAFYAALRQASIPEEWTNAVPAPVARREVLVTEFDTLLAAVHVRRLTTRWPFDPTGASASDTLKLSGRAGQLVGDFLRGQRTWFEATAELGAWYESEGRLADAVRVGLALMQERPYEAGPYEIVGNLMVRLGRLEEALSLYQRADARVESANTKRMAGQLLIRLGRVEEGVSWLERARTMDPANPAVFYDLAVGMLAAGRPSEAVDAAREMMRLEPASVLAQRILQRATEELQAQ